VVPLNAPLVGFLLGVVFAWASADELARTAGSVIGTRSLIVVTVFALLVPVPTTAYFLVLAQDWSLAYLLGGSRLTTALDMALILLTAASTPAGFWSAARSASSRRLRPTMAMGATPAILAAVVVAGLLPRLSVFGTHAQYHGDFGVRPLAGSFVGSALLWTTAVLVGAAVWTARCLRRMTTDSHR
jgi:hypothetical protein